MPGWQTIPSWSLIGTAVEHGAALPVFHALREHDLGSLTDKELKELIDSLTEEENEISYKRRVLHGKIDILRAELVNRLRQKREHGDSLISGDDVEQLTQILAGKAVHPNEEGPA